jgi:uridine kinase
MKPPLIIGVAGGTASGKTSLAVRLRDLLTHSDALLIEQDSYYKDLGHLDIESRANVNFDHPDAFDWDLLIEHLGQLRKGHSIQLPIYDYAIHNRSPHSLPTGARPVILMEGILVLWNPKVREHLDIKLFVDTPSDIRLIRRLRRDTKERGRSLDSVLDQYESKVRLMHEEFCEPSKVHADVIIPRGARNTIAVEMVLSRILKLRDERLKDERA